MWYPKNSESCLSLSKILKSQLKNINELTKLEMVLHKGSYMYDNNNQLLSSSISDTLESIDIDIDDDIKEELSIIFKDIHNRQLFTSRSCLEELALLLYQYDRLDDAYIILRKLGYTWTLSYEVLKYNYIENKNKLISSNLIKFNNINTKEYINIYDNILSTNILIKLYNIFYNNNIFWKEHHYDFLNNSSRTVGYFSYIYEYKQRKPTNLIEQIIDYILDVIKSKNIFPEINDCELGIYIIY
jgi:hypothetical protein